MANTNSSKGNPASRRMSNAHLKASRQACWRSSQERKRGRTEVQHDREVANRALRKAGSPTPWQQACAERAAARTGLREIWLLSQKAEQLPAS